MADMSTKRSNGVAHWSKDYVEHLRTVHFALMAVSVGLIALSLTHPTGKLQKALDQISEIQEASAIADTQDFDWSSAWSEYQVRRAIDSHVVEPKIAPNQFLEAKGDISSTHLLCTLGDATIGFGLSPQWSLIATETDEAGAQPIKKFLRPHTLSQGTWPVAEQSLDSDVP